MCLYNFLFTKCTNVSGILTRLENGGCRSGIGHATTFAPIEVMRLRHRAVATVANRHFERQKEVPANS